MGKALAWHGKESGIPVVVAVLVIHFPFPDKKDQPSFPFRKNGNKLPHGSQASMLPTIRLSPPAFEQLLGYVENVSCLSTLTLLQSLLPHGEGAATSMDGLASTVIKLLVCLESLLCVTAQST